MTGLSLQHKNVSILETHRSRMSLKCNAIEKDVSLFSLSKHLRSDSITLSALLLWQVG